jgi:hypothetical protein
VNDARITLTEIERCEDARCDCRARGVLAVDGFGETTAAFYDDSRGVRASAGRTTGGRRGRLAPADFSLASMQRAVIAAFEVALEPSGPFHRRNRKELTSP